QFSITESPHGPTSQHRCAPPTHPHPGPRPTIPLARRVGFLHRHLRHHRPAPHYLRLLRPPLHLRRLRPRPWRQLRHRQQSHLHHHFPHRRHRQPPRRIRLPDL